MPERMNERARYEWRHYGAVPIAGAIGYSTAGLQIYAIGPFVEPIEQAFGWTRAQIMAGLTISNTVALLCSFLIGLSIDRLGPRRVGLTGIVVAAGGFALLGTASGELLNWWLLWLIVAIGNVLCGAMVWTSAVASRFQASRGLAMATTLTGSSLTAAVAPIVASALLVRYGWQVGMAATGLLWALVSLPVAFLFFRGHHDILAEREEARAAKQALHGFTVREGLRTSAFWRIATANFAFAFYTIALAPNLVPLLGEKGASVSAAAQIAALVGMIGIVARLSAGFLLDRFPPNVVSTIIFLLPVAGCGLMLVENPSYLLLVLAVISFGATIGAEYDVVLYMMARHMGLRNFGALLGISLSGGALAGAIAPLVSGGLHDATGGYDALLYILMTLMALSAVGLATLGEPKRDWSSGNR